MAQNPQRPLAPHVQAAISAAAQPKQAESGGRQLAPHVQRALSRSLQAFAPATRSTIVQLASESTRITLTIRDAVVEGVSSTQYCSHAEMNALHKFIVNHCGGDVEAAYNAIYRARGKKVSCTEKPVCVACAAVLLDLGFAAADDGTEFSDKKAGGVAWGLSAKVKELIEHAQEQGTMKSPDHYLELGKK